MVDQVFAKGLIIAAPHSGSGKTLVTLGLIKALQARGTSIAVAKTGPDYIDTAFLSRAAGGNALNLDPWAMDESRLRTLAQTNASKAGLLLVEGVMGLFDGAANGTGSTADLAGTLQAPVVLVVDAARQSQSIAPLVSGFAHWQQGVKIAGIILNNVGSLRHETLLRAALEKTNIPVVGCLPRLWELHVPDRHLGLVLPAEIAGFDALLKRAEKAVTSHCDLERILQLARPLALTAGAEIASPLPPLGQHVAIAKDQAFVFIYHHWLEDWRHQGAQISFFSPLADQTPDQNATAIFLPGGYPELHGKKIAAAHTFKKAMAEAAGAGKLIYGECGGYMVLGDTLIDKQGFGHEMCGLLPVSTSISAPRRVLGYRRLDHGSPLPWATQLSGHEFHYSTGTPHDLVPLFAAQDASGNALEPMGAICGRVMGSYAHVIDVIDQRQSTP